MKRPPFPLRVHSGFVLNALSLFLLSSAFAQRGGAPVDHKIDIEIMDRALAKANPHDRWVKFGDVGIKYEDLKAYRDRLAAESISRKAESPQPEIVTPAANPAFKWPLGNVNYRFDPVGLTNGTIFKMTPAGAITTLHSFTGSDGSNPIGALVRGTDLNYYGTTQLGGTSNNGTVFKITSGGTLTTLYNFAGSDGSSPAAGLVLGAEGNFYGTTQVGGTNNTGTVFKITSTGTLTTLYSFSASGSEGMNPVAGLVQGRSPDTNFYGTTQFGGGSGQGTVFKITLGGVLTTLYSFSGSDGSDPVAGLVQGASPDTNFYGTTQYGGSHGDGSIFKITSGGTLTTIYNFNYTDGWQPVAGLFQGSDTNFYGTTQLGGASNQGTIFKITSAGTLTTLHSFVLNDGQEPVASLIQAADTNFYGTVFRGGTNADGTTFSITSAGTFTPLHTFIGTDGTNPMAGLIQGTGGDTNFYGTTPGTNVINALKMQQFRDGVAEWAAFANLHFIELTTGAAPTNFITVQETPPGQGEGGFSSSVGMAGGEQFIRVGPNSWNRGTVCHEVGHALGLWHEQQRPDRDTYVTINFGNINPGLAPNFAIINNGDTHSTSYDFYSVMHYQRKTFALDPNVDTISMKPGYTQYADIIGNVIDRTLSKIERAGMAAVYGNPSPLPGAVVTNTNDSGPGSLRTAIYYAFDASPGVTTISFSIPTSDPGYNSGTGLFTIKPTFSLPALGDHTTINGNSQIVLDGSNFAALQVLSSLYSPGLILRAANCTIKALTIINFNQWGIRIYQGADPNGSAATGNVIGGTTAAERNVISGNAFHGIAIHDSTSTGNVVEGNYIGTNQTGTAAQGNGNAGVAIYLGAHGNTIGGTAAGTGNVISGNGNQGVLLADAGTNNNLVQGNYIGLNASGTATVPNIFSGIELFGGAQSNTIGGTSMAARNIISGNSGVGIAVDEFNDVTAIGTRNNLIEGNFIGLDHTGLATVANQGDGIDIFDGAPSNTIGGAIAGAGNVISGNTSGGVNIAASNGTLIQGNYIGMDLNGTTAKANNGPGLYVWAGAQNTTIGGTSASGRNVISGNTSDGIDLNGATNTTIQGNYIGVDVSGAIVKANGGTGVALFNAAASNTIGGTSAAARNVISGNTGAGLTISGNATLNLVQGNYIGLDVTGTTAKGNGNDGVALFGGANANTIGGTAAGARNVISANGSRGVSLGNTGTNNNVVQGNYIGVDVNGTIAKANGGDGVAIYGAAQSNTIGGTTTAARNIVSGNTGTGISIGNTNTKSNLVQGNYIGVDSGGAAALANNGEGVSLYAGAQMNTIGGVAPGGGNVISGNGARGIGFFDAATSNNFVQGNYIGLNAAGTGTLGNAFSGVEFYLASNNTLGGTSPGARNFISGNQDRGVLIDGSGTSGNLVQGNTIGLNVNGAAAANLTRGIEFFGGPQLNTIGGSAVGAANVIADNGGEGVALFDLATSKNKISQNSIFGNTTRGIGMGALYSNSNSNQPAPTLSSAVLSPSIANAGGTDVGGNFSGGASTIEFYASPPGNDEGQFFIGSLAVAGAGNFSVSLAAAVPKNYLITATATDGNGNTSQFSATQLVTTTTDTDGDGIPDNWMMKYFGHTTGMASDKSRATDDADGTGMTNLQKFLAGLDPKNPNSFLRISSIAPNSGNPQIGFPSVSGKTYRLDYCNDLVTGSWLTLTDQIFGTGATIQIVDPSAAGLSRRFYRISLEP